MCDPVPPESMSVSEMVKRVDRYIKRLVEEKKPVTDIEVIDTKVHPDGSVTTTMRIWNAELAASLIASGAKLVEE